MSFGDYGMAGTDAHGKDAFINYPQDFGIEWISKRQFRLKGYEFDIPTNFEDFLISNEVEDDKRFYLAKTADLIRRYINLIKPGPLPPQAILEIGVFRGGSAAFLQLITKAKQFLALELAGERIDILDKFVANEGLEDSFRIEYGVDQGDTVRVRELVTDYFGSGRCIDLVIDDASHILGPTRRSFETVFPFLRTNGSYVVEDYANLHMLTSRYLNDANSGSKAAQKIIDNTLSNTLQADHQPLHLLAVEMMLASINAPQLISKVILDRHWLRIIRGPADVRDVTAFDLRALADDQFSLLKSAPSPAVSKILKGMYGA